MKDLWPDTRALLDAGRDGEEPSAHDYERNRLALVQKLGAGVMVASAGVVSTTGAAAAGAAASSGALTSVILSFVLGGAVGGAAAISARWTHDHPSRDPRVVVSTLPTPSPNQGASARVNVEIRAPLPHSALPGESETTAASPREGRVEVPPRRPHESAVDSTAEERPALPRETLGESPSPVRGGKPPSNVEEELGLLRTAQERLHMGAPAAALAILDEHARRFPDGTLVEERRASRILALCQLGDVARGRAEADQFIAQLPMSPFVERIRRACAP